MKQTVTQGRTGLDPEFMEEWIGRLIALWNAHDVEGIVSLYTANVFYRDPAHPEPIHGQEELRRFLTSMFQALPDLHVEPLEPLYYLSATSPKALAPYRFVGTMLGDWDSQDLAATGARVDMEGITAWEFEDGLVSRYATYADALGVIRQLGVLPQAGSMSYRLMTGIQHLQAGVQRRRNNRGPR